MRIQLCLKHSIWHTARNFQHQHSFAEYTVYRALEHKLALNKQYNLRLHYQLLKQVVFFSLFVGQLIHE